MDSAIRKFGNGEASKICHKIESALTPFDDVMSVTMYNIGFNMALRPK